LQAVSVTAGGTEVDQFLVSVFAKSGSILSERLHFFHDQVWIVNKARA